MADDEDAVAAACAIVAILADSHNCKRKQSRNMDTTKLTNHSASFMLDSSLE